jgi:hypothetical protein
MPEPEVTTRIWSQVCVCQPVVQPWLKFTTLQAYNIKRVIAIIGVGPLLQAIRA